MTLRFEPWIKTFFGFRIQHVYFKVIKEDSGLYPWEQLDSVYFCVAKTPKGWAGDMWKWELSSRTDKSDEYLLDKYGKTRLLFKTKKELVSVLEAIIPDWHKVRYSGGKELPIIFA